MEYFGDPSPTVINRAINIILSPTKVCRQLVKMTRTLMKVYLQQFMVNGYLCLDICFMLFLVPAFRYGLSDHCYFMVSQKRMETGHHSSMDGSDSGRKIEQ